MKISPLLPKLSYKVAYMFSETRVMIIIIIIIIIRAFVRRTMSASELNLRL